MIKRIKKDPCILYPILVVVLAACLFCWQVYTAWGTSSYTDKLGLEMPERGDVGWDDAIRLNHKIFEIVTMPMLEGNFVTSGATVSGTTQMVTWQAGTVYLNGVSRYLPSGVTVITNNTISILSAVTPGAAANQVTMQVRSTEYDLPNSGASGFYHVPLYLATVESGNIVRLKDVRYMPRWKFPLDQDVASGATPTFSGLNMKRARLDVYDLNVLGGVSVPSGVSKVGASQSGAVFLDTNDKALLVGVAGSGHGVMLEKTYEITIASPDLLDNKNQIPLFTVPSGVSYYITGCTIYADTSGVSVEGIVYSTSQFNYTFGSGTTLFNYSTLSSSGTSVWYYVAPSGTSVVPTDRTVLADFGISTPGWVKFQFVGRLEAGP